MEQLLYAVPAVGAIALIAAFLISSWVKRNNEGNSRMREIASYIREGAMAFIVREYGTIAVYSVVMLIVVGFMLTSSEGAKNAWLTAASFIVGSSFTALAGYCGMRTATNSNVRTAAAAQSSGMGQALKIAFRGGSVMGLCVVGFGALGVGLLLSLFGMRNATILIGFSLGASSVSLFGRVGGGIYTKAADVGADLVGKVETGIPEDDPRNPAVIADNVGDNVGDVAGMGSDLFESYVSSIIATILLTYTAITTFADKIFANVQADTLTDSAGTLTALGQELQTKSILFPLILAAVGIFASLFAVFLVGGKNTKDPAKSLNIGTYTSGAIVLVVSTILSKLFFGSFAVAVAVASGLVIGVAIGIMTEVFTSSNFRSVKSIARHAETGPATTIIDGFAVGMLSTVAPIALIAVGIYVSNIAAGLYGIAIAAVGMLSTTGIVVAVDAYGPISDNAGGIAQMSGLPKNVREITDKLDSVGNTTAAIGKGFATGSAALTALALFVSYAEAAKITSIDLLDPGVVIGMLIGGTLPFLFSAQTMRSVGKAAFRMIEEVRRQFRERPGIMDGSEKPDYAACVDISTKAALKEMMFPAVLAILSPILVGVILGPEALGGLLAGSLVTGVLLAITMANAGGAWDNAKKYIESGQHGGKGSEAYKASVVGDTVGDPFKDTSGPSINILIKMMTIVSVVFLPLFMR